MFVGVSRLREYMLGVRAVMDAPEMLVRATAVIDILRYENIEWARRYRDLAVAFMLHHDQPDVDLREELQLMISALEDEISIKEEHLL